MPGAAAVAFHLSSRIASRLIAAAGSAPSPDNNQPWLFRVREAAIDVFHCREREVPSDVDNLFAGLALGAAIENMVLEASRQGLAAEVDYAERPFEQVDGCEAVATVKFTPEGASDRLAELLGQRVTNRRPYARTALSSSQLAAMNDAIADADCELIWLTDRTSLNRLASLIYAADRIRFEYQPFHDELHRVLRLTHDEAQATRDGLDFASLEIPRIARPLFRWLRPWSRMNFLNRFGLSRIFARNSIVQIERSAAVGLLATRRADALGYLQAGRAFERVWLAAAGDKLAFQPLGALPLFLRRLAVQGSEAFLPQHARRLKAVRDEFGRLFPQLAGTPVMLFRVGHGRPPSARSLRYRSEDIQLRQVAP